MAGKNSSKGKSSRDKDRDKDTVGVKESAGDRGGSTPNVIDAETTFSGGK